ncbi:murein L,D-transpeptidase catalytic domain family protein [Novilysobacter antarcticus]|uniref:murein L,D-transpeptidase catalytic domain family protein n=1 Tax=Novilysobacter antarcticus TaxID=2862543 RepID=UPI001C9A1530
MAEPDVADERPIVSGLLDALRAAAPEIDPGVLALALEARSCALNSGTAVGTRLAVIDYSLPSTRKRMWVFDVDQPGLLYAEHVAHGQGSGENMSNRFSNVDGSHQTSLGLFRTAETYVGGNGYSLRMDGLEPGVNDNARDRLIVIHGAPYVNPEQAQRQGRLGRSYGCPALRPQVAREVIDTIKNDQLVFAYYPDDPWLKGSRFFGCGGRTAGQILADARNGAASHDAVASAGNSGGAAATTL